MIAINKMPNGDNFHIGLDDEKFLIQIIVLIKNFRKSFWTQKCDLHCKLLHMIVRLRQIRGFFISPSIFCHFRICICILYMNLNFDLNFYQNCYFFKQIHFAIHLCSKSKKQKKNGVTAGISNDFSVNRKNFNRKIIN